METGLIATYVPELVVTSFVVAVAASYAALKTTGRIRASDAVARRWWLAGGALAMGIGVWSMHFIGMLALRLPIPLGYDIGVTVLSLLMAVAASGYALWLVTRDRMGRLRLLSGAVVMGLGIAAMHYVGMAAMRMQPAIIYQPVWFAASLLIAIGAAGAALAIAYRLRDNARHERLHRALAAGVMGVAIVGMHYTGMAAAHFPAGSICSAALRDGLSPDSLAWLVVVVNTAVLGTAIGASALDRLLHERTARLSDSLQQANRQLTHLAMHDALTGLPNRLMLIERLQSRMLHAQLHGERFAVLFIDLDGFKGVNDAFGHHVGDALLVRVADMLRRMATPADTVARLGGDEFVMVTSVAEAGEASVRGERLLGCLAEATRLQENDDVTVSASIGIALYPGDGEDAQALLAHADAAMYYIKQAGRNGLALYAPAMGEEALGQLQLTYELRKALERGQLVLHYQPQIRAADNAMAGMEALVRWQHPRLGLVMPDRFIALAERAGLIVDLGQWVLDEACRQWAAWRRAGARVPSVSVNLSPVQVRGDSLVGQVTAAMRRHGLPAGALTLEITESIAMLEPERTAQVLTQLVEAGARISVDDFGTGYSSLSYLACLPAHELKVDRQFVRQMTTGPRHAAIVQSVVLLGQQLGLEVVAEGVETLEQKQMLVAMGCHRLQGYYIGQPRPVEEMPVSSLVRQEPFAASGTHG
ncbi:EAL domain-containing protein [Pseudoxanthomonas sp. LH2527]|uniref:putative bifunctional diguanylate cyclase/phosphodiesterase n=1 Tax=Pseudoxanthomonas sp. LH2527 TaxID=2923249 RepID=UPI001F138135|nr:bifunctional diguanylate cyclase/phosphodiesterase [Pseudoxanthomonas sp. LH2527]MCH6485397.1 EAL domain-containing protein [Pseudoxanthomonas sp. LH2527]